MKGSKCAEGDGKESKRGGEGETEVAHAYFSLFLRFLFYFVLLVRSALLGDSNIFSTLFLFPVFLACLTVSFVKFTTKVRYKGVCNFEVSRVTKIYAFTLFSLFHHPAGKRLYSLTRRFFPKSSFSLSRIKTD